MLYYLSFCKIKANWVYKNEISSIFMGFLGNDLVILMKLAKQIALGLSGDALERQFVVK